MVESISDKLQASKTKKKQGKTSRVPGIERFISGNSAKKCCRLIQTWETWKKSSIHSVCPWGKVRIKVLSPNPQLLHLG